MIPILKLYMKKIPFMKGLVSVVAIELTFFSAGEVLGIDFSFIKNNNWLGYYFACSIPIIISISYILITLIKTKSKPIEIRNLNFIDSLFNYFDQCISEKDYEEIIRFGTAISRPLWLSQNYESRKRVGEYVYNAALQTKNEPVKIRFLIDDIGWTSIELLQYDEAEKNLKQGIKLSESSGDIFYKAKAYRHLFGLNYRMGNNEKAQKMLNIAIKETKKISTSKAKDEAVAEINYSQSLLNYNNEKFNEAIKNIEYAEPLFKKLSRKEWSIKVSIQKAEILIKQDDTFAAEEIILECINESVNHHFNKQHVRSLMAKCHLFYYQHKHNLAIETYEKALQIAKKIGMKYEIRLINQELEKIQRLC